MTERIEYGSKDAADAARERREDYLCPVDDDRRLLTVAYVSDTPDAVLEDERLRAEDGKGERSSGPGQVPLSDAERDRLDYSQPRANEGHARSVKGIAQAEGVEDWTSYYDGTLTVDEHREVMQRAGRESGDQRRTESVEEKAGRAARRARKEGCDHAEGGCENGDPEACEFLQNVCGYSEDEVAQFLDDDRDDEGEQTELVTVGGDEYPEMELRPEVAGALRKSWTGYKGAIRELEAAISQVRESTINARQAWRAINRIREANGQDEMHPDRLHTLLDAADAMPGNIPIVRTLDHFADSDESDPGAAPVDAEDGPESAQQFAAEQQGTLSVGVESEEAAEEKQVTLTGADDAGNETAPTAWRQQGTTWSGGPHSVSLDSPSRGVWVVRLTGPAGPMEIVETDDAATAEEVAEAFTDRLQPNEVTGHNADRELQEAAAEAKKEAYPDSGGLLDY
ncbi:hypothetical protein [Haloarcula marina]|uniref:hypothetical protein n=1 Tax=Haloarcula marina TaxID=2961574 RepID=UPI0020B88F33|nr:hypothetical protein [Halomicroarcula marina]